MRWVNTSPPTLQVEGDDGGGGMWVVGLPEILQETCALGE